MRTTRKTVRVRPGSGRLGRPGVMTHPRLPNPARWLALLLIPLLLLTGGLLWSAHQAQSAPLADYVLAGARSPACVRIVVLRDQSGSMVGFEAARESAMQQLVEWGTSPDTLRADDELAIIDFAGDGQVALSTVRFSAASTSIPSNAALVLDSTEISAAVMAMRDLPDTVCSTGLIALSDGLIAPLDAAARAELTAQGVSHVALILPGDMPAPIEWTADFPSSQVSVASADDADVTARAVGEAVAATVGQRLERR